MKIRAWLVTLARPAAKVADRDRAAASSGVISVGNGLLAICCKIGSRLSVVFHTAASADALAEGLPMEALTARRALYSLFPMTLENQGNQLLPNSLKRYTNATTNAEIVNEIGTTN